MTFDASTRNAPHYWSKRQSVRALGLAALLLALGTFPVSARVATEDPSSEQPPEATVEAVPVAGPFEFPWSAAFLPDGAVLVTERPGRLQLLATPSERREVSGLPPVFSNVEHGHAGLLDVAIDPQFADNSRIYLSYVHGSAGHSTLRVARATLDLPRAELTNIEVIFESNAGDKPELYGARMALSPHGYLFLTLGDRWQPAKAQDITQTTGTIIRIHSDGSIPTDNPFVFEIPEARPEIWSYGHRNPLGLALDADGRLWSHENGPQGGDELNLIEPGRNYGWPVISHGLEYAEPPPSGHGQPRTIVGTAREGMEQPVHHWTPAIAPSGLAVENADEALVFWIGALRGNALVRLEMQNREILQEQHIFAQELGRIRDVRIASDGQLYLLTDGPEGFLYRIDPLIEQVSRDKDRERL